MNELRMKHVEWFWSSPPSLLCATCHSVILCSIQNSIIYLFENRVASWNRRHDLKTMSSFNNKLYLLCCECVCYVVSVLAMLWVCLLCCECVCYVVSVLAMLWVCLLCCECVCYVVNVLAMLWMWLLCCECACYVVNLLAMLRVCLLCCECVCYVVNVLAMLWMCLLCCFRIV